MFDAIIVLVDSIYNRCTRANNRGREEIRCRSATSSGSSRFPSSIAIQGAYVGLSLAVQVAEAAGVRRRLLLAGAAFSLAVAIWAMHFVGMLAVRLPFPIDYLVLPTLLSFLVCVIVVGAGDFRGECRATDAASPCSGCDFHGARDRLDALSRDERAPRERPYAPCADLRRGKRSDRHCGLGPGAVPCRRKERPAAADPVSHGARLRDRRHALHGDGWPHRHAARGGGDAAHRRSPPTCWRSSLRSWRSACRGSSCLTLVPDRKGQRASSHAADRSLGVFRSDSAPALSRIGRARRSKVSPPIAVRSPSARRRIEAGRAPQPENEASHSHARPAPSDRCARARPISWRSAISSRFTPTRTTRPFSTERRSSSARFRSARSRRGSTTRISSASTAATSSIWSGWSG